MQDDNVGIQADSEIDYDGPVAPYMQLARILQARIERGGWGPGRPIPSEKRLVQEYGLARSTVRRTVQIFAEHGTVYTVPGRGSYVTKQT